jgi:hypothetical protein
MHSTNTTCPINIPELWHNGDCSLLCRPAKWYDILIFFSGNYLAHAATVTSTPGAAPLSRALNMLKALLFPISGFILGLEAIASMAMAAKTPLQTAARAGALLMVVKTGKRRQAIRAIGNVQRNPNGGGGAVELSDLEQGHSLSNSAPQVHRYRPWCSVKIHGYDHLPEGYEFRRVYRRAVFKNDEKEAPEKWFFDKFSKRDRTATDVACSYNGAKAIVSIVQLVFGIATLYRTRGDQVERFGYAAYGLTVTPYALMSAFNLVGNLLRPDYPSMYIVKSQALVELQNKTNSEIKIGTVGEIDEKSTEARRNNDARKSDPTSWFVPCMLGAFGVHLLVVGIMTKFSKGHSTHAQRVWIICWLVFGGFVTGIVVAYQVAFQFEEQVRGQQCEDEPDTRTADNQIDVLPTKPALPLLSDGEPNWWISELSLILCYGAPAVGGFVVVAQMIENYGVCSKLLHIST